MGIAALSPPLGEDNKSVRGVKIFEELSHRFQLHSFNTASSESPDAYNSIIKVEKNSKRSYNAMVNTGATAITNLIEGRSPAHKLNLVLGMYQRYVGRRVYMDTSTLISEQTSGDRNWAISYLLR
ncbi:glutaminase [cyanobacterium endosymbiont of Rhopalodia gibberula]|uniref:glutaminase n=1 Tax=cyanobacterium endosymbiont of Rhopalodia gibberula TaxID=1763363 RepID=UPI00268D2603